MDALADRPFLIVYLLLPISAFPVAPASRILTSTVDTRERLPHKHRVFVSLPLSSGRLAATSHPASALTLDNICRQTPAPSTAVNPVGLFAGLGDDLNLLFAAGDNIGKITMLLNPQLPTRS